ncbi:MAG: type II toxin-antitoxin system RelE/ParE family toxin [Clostridia bacterium]|jgi:plasmid stabilization system protein ParE|nr:type II toxin-antitoxin system RelE/ParE family toxin [Clostridia bacterium]
MQDKFQYKFTGLALQDIDEAMSYISDSLANPIAAENLYNQIEKAIDQICLFPYAYADCSCYLIDNRDIRHIRVGNYVMIYEVVTATSTLHILRFRYAMMDLTKVNF